jgi:uncharacterized protein YbjT (DUF2867 family)
MVIAVTAASGALGRRIAARLVERGVRPRLVVRDAARAPRLSGPADVVTAAGYHDRESLRAALAGADTVVLISATEDAHRVRLHTTAVDAARDARVSRIVYTSFLGAGPACTFTFGRDHWHTEQHIRASGLGYTFLRDNLYLDVLPYFPGPDGVLRGPAGIGRFGGVARDDIADAAAGVLTAADPTVHDGRTYDLTGPEAISMAEVAEALTVASGRTVSYYAETLSEAYESRSGFGAADWEVAGWVTSYTAIAVGELDVVTTAVADLAGHPPMSFADYLARNPAELDRLRG